MRRRDTAILNTVSAGLAFLSVAAPPLAGRIATWLWFSPFPLARPETPSIPTGARRVTFESSGSTVHAYQLGEGGKTALLVHGWAGSGRQYRRIARRLVELDYTCVVVDLPAHGVGAGQSTHPFEMSDAIETVGSNLGEIDLIVAHSLGATATASAMQRSLRAERLVLVAPGLRPRQGLELFASRLRLRPSVVRVVERAMETQFGCDVWERVPSEMLAMRVPAMTLVVHDIDDDMVPIEDVELISETWGVELLRTHSYGHNGVLRSSHVVDRIAALAITGPPTVGSESRSHRVRFCGR